MKQIDGNIFNTSTLKRIIVAGVGLYLLYWAVSAKSTSSSTSLEGGGEALVPDQDKEKKIQMITGALRMML